MARDRAPKAAVRYGLGVGVLLLLGLVFLVGVRLSLYTVVALVAAALILVVGTGRIFRAAVTREADSITCRYIPWYEGNPYLALVALPLIGIAAIGAPPANHGGPGLWRILGILVVAVTPISLFFFLREWRRCFLRITPSELKASDPSHGYAVKAVRREQVQSIASTTGSLVDNADVTMTQIVYREVGSSADAAEVLLIGPSNSRNAIWLTIEPADLLAALQVWKDGDVNDPGLIDRIELILRGQQPPLA